MVASGEASRIALAAESAATPPPMITWSYRASRFVIAGSFADRVVPPRSSGPPTPPTVPIPVGAGPGPRADRPIRHTPLRHPGRHAVPFPRYRPRVVEIGGTKRRVVLTHGAPGPRAEPGPSLRRGPPGVPAIGPCSRPPTGRAWQTPPRSATPRG